MKIGAVPYLNGKPLVHGLDRLEGVEYVEAVPSHLAKLLQEGKIDVGLVSAAACFVNPDLVVMPGISISCKGKAESVKMFYRGELKDVSRVALDTGSLTSVLLSRVILKEKYGLEPLFVEKSPPLSEMLSKNDAAVMIGDNTMCAGSAGLSFLDLGTEWHSITGLPFVFAVWTAREKAASFQMMEILNAAKSAGMAALDRICESESERLGIEYSVCMEYLSDIIDYELGVEQMMGLGLFKEKASGMGLIPGGIDLKYWDGQ